MEALPAEHRTSLRRLKGDSGLLAAVGATRACFHFLVRVRRSRAHGRRALCLTRLAALGFVLELFVVEEELFASREEKFRAAVDALQHPVLEFHVISPHRLLRSNATPPQ